MVTTVPALEGQCKDCRSWSRPETGPIAVSATLEGEQVASLCTGCAGDARKLEHFIFACCGNYGETNVTFQYRSDFHPPQVKVVLQRFLP